MDYSENILDVVIIGAGISGINAAYRLQTTIPGCNYTIFETRGAIGGTWDLFRYPGIRSDSDLYTFGFPWQPWEKQNPIADGDSIISYMKETAAKHGIDRHISFHHKLLSANWSSKQQAWNLTFNADGEKKQTSARFLILGTGYYNYYEPYQSMEQKV